MASRIEIPAKHRLRLTDDEGFTTISMVIAIVLSLALVLSAAQIYRLQSNAAEIQEVADVSALAAENMVAEFMIAVRLCDAVVLSLSLLTLTVYGLAVVALCIPMLAGLGAELIDIASHILSAREQFAEKASEGLTKLQSALPYLSAANAAHVAIANNGTSGMHAYFSCAVLVPAHITPLAIESDAKTEQVGESVEANKDELAQAARVAEEAARKANAAKEKGFKADCGNAPAACMMERAERLAGLSGTSNPAYASVDTWSFSVALERARTYYRAREAQERPANATVKEQSNSALRAIFFTYANEELAKAYVHETDTSFDAYFPLLFHNTDEMRQSRLYGAAIFPITNANGTSVMHAWNGCPQAGGIVAYGSIAQMEAGGFTECPQCQFKATDLGKVAAASSSIDNGFEYYFRQVAEAAREYELERKTLDEQSQTAHDVSGSLLDQIKEAMQSVAGKRINITPPGSFGAVALVTDLKSFSADAGFMSSFVHSSGTLGPRAAVSAATLFEEPAGEAGSLITALLDGFGTDGGAAVGATRVVLDAWSELLSAYTEGVDAMSSALDATLGSMHLASASGLGKWSAERFREGLDAIGLVPAKLDALKPVLVNTGRVTAAENSTFSVRFLSLKQGALRLTDTRGSIFSGLLDHIESEAGEWIESTFGSIEIACIEIPVLDISIPITIGLPPSIAEGAQGAVSQAIEALRNVIGDAVRGQRWQ